MSKLLRLFMWTQGKATGDPGSEKLLAVLSGTFNVCTRPNEEITAKLNSTYSISTDVPKEYITAQITSTFSLSTAVT